MFRLIVPALFLAVTAGCSTSRPHELVSDADLQQLEDYRAAHPELNTDRQSAVLTGFSETKPRPAPRRPVRGHNSGSC